MYVYLITKWGIVMTYELIRITNFNNGTQPTHTNTTATTALTTNSSKNK